MSWGRNNLATHALPSFLCDSLSSSSAGLNLGRHLGQAGTFPMVAGNGPNTSVFQFMNDRDGFWRGRGDQPGRKGRRGEQHQSRRGVSLEKDLIGSRGNIPAEPASTEP